MSCKCHRPVENINPRGRGLCVKCSHTLDPRWTTNLETFREFFGRLRESLFPYGILYGPDAPGPPDSYLAFEQECRDRFLAGQETFGLRFLDRDNIRDGQEEASDGANYAWMHLLKQRQRGEGEEWALALTAAYHAAKLHETLDLLGQHQHLPFSDTDQSEAMVRA